jgi:hypothetical protein
MLHNNEYNINLISNIAPQKKLKQNTHADSQQQRTQWIAFMYSGKEVRAMEQTKTKLAATKTKNNNTKQINKTLI